MAVYFDILTLLQIFYRSEKDSERNSVNKDTEIYSYADKIAEHSAEYQSDAHYHHYLKIHLIRIKAEERKAYRRRYYGVNYRKHERQHLLFGETVNVAAQIKQLPGISGHADLNGLLDWAKAVKGVTRFFINHGEASSAESFAQRLREELDVEVYAPYSGAEFDLASNTVTIDAQPVFIPKKVNTANMNTCYSDLVQASDRLAALIKNSEGRTNADMRKLTDMLNKLCDDWKI